MRLTAILAASLLVTASAEARVRKAVIIAGKKSHGLGAHEYVKSARLLKVMLDRSNVRDLKTEIHFNGWPEDPSTLDDADTIMTISDGQDGDRYSPAPFMTDERMKIIEKQMARGCGFVTFHFSTFTPDRYGPSILEWGGGYFDWQDDSGARNWYSKIKTLETEVKPASPAHPISRGLAPFRYREEFYYSIRFRDNDPRLTPILQAPELGEGLVGTVAWAVQRDNGGRGFGTTTGHFFENWRNANYRTMILNAIAWTAGAEIPSRGVQSRYFEEDEVNRLLVPNPVRTLLVTGDNHPSHKWKETTPAIVEALENRGPEFAVTVTDDPEDLAHLDLASYQLIVLNYCNWTRSGLSDAAKQKFVAYLQGGGGLASIHFANGAFHPSLPKAPPSDWPEYRKIVARVWDHAKGLSGHDKYGPFRVNIANPDHPITRGLAPFDTVDELYFRQQGDVPVTVLASARSNVTGNEEPLAWTYRYGKARVFQTVLGHSKESLGTHGMMQLIRRGSAWAAAQRPSPAWTQLPIDPNIVRLGEIGAGEGPAWLPGEGLLFSGQGGIGIWKDGKGGVFRDPAGRPNGLLIDQQGRLVVNESGERRVTRTEKNGAVTVLADRFEGMRFNAPNDLSIDSKGRIYFSDPRYGKRDGMEMRDAQGNTVEGVYRIDGPGSVHRVIGREVERANGVLVSPNDEFLYVADNNNNAEGGARKLWRFALRPDGSVDTASRRLIFDWGNARGPDGVKMDRQGRLFVAAGLNKPNPPYETADRLRGGIFVLSGEGKLIQFLPVPVDEVTNCAFGGDDLRTLYITAGGTLFRARLNAPGWIAGTPR